MKTLSGAAAPEKSEDDLSIYIETLRTKLAENDDPHLPYTPYLRAVHSGSRGYAQRVPGSLTNRLHDFLSRHEFHIFLMFDWRKNEFRNIREQFSVPLGLTKALVRRRGGKPHHPWNRFEKKDAVMTVDFLLSKNSGGWTAVDVKETRELRSKRTKFKLDLMAETLAQVDVPHVVMTQDDIPRQVIRNYRFIRILSLPFDPPPIQMGEIERAEQVLRPLLLNGRTPIFDAALTASKDLGTEASRLARACYWLVANRWWTVDFNYPIGPDYPLFFTN